MILNVLLIVNIEIDIEKISFILNSHFSDLEIHSAGNNSNLFGLVESLMPDIIIFDIDQTNSQEKDNLEVLIEILRIKQFPVIVLTSANDFKKVLKSGAINFIQKPYTEITLA